MKTIYKRTYKINPDCLFEAAKTKKTLELYCFHLNLHSLSKNKVVFNYKAKTKYLSAKTGFTQRKVKELLKTSIIEGFATVDFNSSHLRIASKLFTLKYFNKEITGNEMPKWAAKFITIETSETIDIHTLKTLILQVKQNQKGFACASNFLKKKFITSNSKIQKAQIQSHEKEYIHGVAKFDHNVFLYLQDIRNLFNYKDNSGASKLLKKLQQKKLIKSYSQFQFLRQKEGFADFIDSKRMKKTVCKNDDFFLQHPNFLSFNLPFKLHENNLVKFNNKCLEKVLKTRKQRKKEKKESITRLLSELRTGKFDKKVPENTKPFQTSVKTKELFRNSSNQVCGQYTYTKIGKNKCWKRVKFYKSLDIGGVVEELQYCNLKKEWITVNIKNLCSSHIGCFEFLKKYSKLDMDEQSYNLILKSLDKIKPMFVHTQRPDRALGPEWRIRFPLSDEYKKRHKIPIEWLTTDGSWTTIDYINHLYTNGKKVIKIGENRYDIVPI